MKDIHCIEFQNERKEERLPNFSADFPYIASRVEPDKYWGGFAPWHWHKEVELFYIEKGALEYETPKGKMVFPAGSAGLVNSNVLHTAKAYNGVKGTVQFLHIFHTSLIGGWPGSRIEQKYILPLVNLPEIEIIPLYPNVPGHIRAIDAIRKSFQYTEEAPDYEIRLRGNLAEIWYQIFEISEPLRKESENCGKANEKLKQMMTYIHEHYGEKLSVREMAGAAFISERECYRVFHDCLHMTPVEYIRSYRLQKACHLLAQSRESVTGIGHRCGMGSSSYFGKIFYGQMGCTPSEYRRKWQDNDNTGQK